MKKIQIDDCICHSKIKEHLEIRDSILSEIEKSSDGNLEQKDSFYTDSISKLDWDISDKLDRPWVKIFLPVFIKNLEEVITSIGYAKVAIKNIWYQQYLEGDTHGWHIHDDHFTGVYYLEFPEGCSQTEIISPYSFKAVKIDASEGDFVVFPAHYIHRGLPNGSKRKTIISYNFSADGSPIDGKCSLDTNKIKKVNPNISWWCNVIPPQN
tara:strand:+ start:26 stop:655 length:630 start_codon:yes stop_codon:yes gene_type:complete